MLVGALRLLVRDHFKQSLKRLIKKTIVITFLLAGTWLAACALVHTTDTSNPLQIKNLDFPKY